MPHVPQHLDASLAAALERNHYPNTPLIRQQLAAFMLLLTKWNRVFSLTALTDHASIISHHILDSVAILPYLSGNYLLDLGSGNGVPGLLLAIVDPSREWVLLDKNSKKTRFLTQVVAELGLTNVVVHCHDVALFHSKRVFTSIVSRAFGSINNFLTSSVHLSGPNTQWLAMKGIVPEDELAAMPPTFTLLRQIPLHIVGLAATRHLLIMTKEAS